MRRRIFITSALPLMLAACEKNVGVSADHSQSTAVKKESSISDADTINTTKVERTTIKTVLLTAMLGASTKVNSLLREYNPAQSKEDKKKLIASGAYDLGDQALRREDAYLRDGEPYDATVYADDQMVTRAAQLFTLPNSIPSWAKKLDENVARYLQGDIQAGRDLAIRLFAQWLSSDAVKPSVGWPEAMKSVKVSTSEHLFVFKQSRRLQFAQYFLTEMSKFMPRTLHSPDDVALAYIDALYKLSNADIFAIYAQANDKAESDLRQHITIDGATGRGTAWVAGASEYNGQMSGWTYKSGGQTMFGDGHLMGSVLELDLATTLEVGSKIERSGKMNSSVGNEQAAKGSAGVK